MHVIRALQECCLGLPSRLFKNIVKCIKRLLNTGQRGREPNAPPKSQNGMYKSVMAESVETGSF